MSTPRSDTMAANYFVSEPNESDIEKVTRDLAATLDFARQLERELQEVLGQCKALEKWQEDHLRILSVSNQHFRGARQLVREHLSDPDCGVEGICRDFLNTLEKLALAKESLEFVLQSARPNPIEHPALFGAFEHAKATLKTL